MKGKKLITVVAIFIVTTLNAKPRVSLAHFEKDLQSMSKKSKNVTIKVGSFVDCLADKRRKKEIIEQEIAGLQQEVDALAKEVEQYETAERELVVCIAEQKNKLQQRVDDMRGIVAQLAQAYDVLHPMAQRDV